MTSQVSVVQTTLGSESQGDLDLFTLQMRSLLGGMLFTVLAQRPSWPMRTDRRWVNILLLVADPEQPRCEAIFRQHYLRSHPSFDRPTEVVGLTGFIEKMELGDPAAFHFVSAAEVLYDAGGIMDQLRRFTDETRGVAGPRLHAYLVAKSQAHFRNFGFLLARVLNELFMGVMASLTAKLIEGKQTVSVATLTRAGQWNEMKRMADETIVSRQLRERVDGLLYAIQPLLASDPRPEEYQDFVKPLVTEARDLIELVGMREHLSQ
jgi:hypothetical protein